MMIGTVTNTAAAITNWIRLAAVDAELVDQQLQATRKVNRSTSRM